MTILVTGGAGYIGSHAVLELLLNNYEVVVIDNLSNSSEESLRRIKDMTNKSFSFYKVDLLDKESLREIFKSNQISAVMHFAGLKSVGESINSPLEYYSNNVVTTMNLCEIMKEFCVSNLVFSSSATVYGTPDVNPIIEEEPLKVTNPYGRTKLIVEEFLSDLSNSDSFWKIVILRYFNPIGASETGNIGESPNNIPNNLMPYITQVAIGTRNELSVFGGDYNTIDGTGVRDYIHVIDLVKGHIKALDYLKFNNGIATFNLGTGKGYSVLELIKAFEKVTNKKIPYKIVNRRPGDVDICYADPKKARTLMNWEAKKSLEDMCSDAWSWQSNNPDGYA